MASPRGRRSTRRPRHSIPPGRAIRSSTRLDTQAIRSDTENQTNLAPITDAVGQPAPNARRLFNRTMEIDLVDTRRSTPDKLATVYSGKASTVGQHGNLGWSANA